MASITLKALPVSLHRALKLRAALNKRSLNREVLAILAAATSPAPKVDVEAIIAEDRLFRASLKWKGSVEKLLKHKRDGLA